MSAVVRHGLKDSEKHKLWQAVPQLKVEIESGETTCLQITRRLRELTSIPFLTENNVRNAIEVLGLEAKFKSRAGGIPRGTVGRMNARIDALEQRLRKLEESLGVSQ